MFSEADAGKARAVWPALPQQSILCVKLLCPRGCVQWKYLCVHTRVHTESKPFSSRLLQTSSWNSKRNTNTELKSGQESRKKVFGQNIDILKDALFILTLVRKTFWHNSLKQEMTCSSNLFMRFLSSLLLLHGYLYLPVLSTSLTKTFFILPPMLVLSL